MKNFIKGFKPALKDMGWLDWSYLLYVVFVSVLFHAVVAELQREIRG